MAKIFMPELSPEERLQVLRNHADKVEDTTYERELSIEELDAKREQFVDNSIKVSRLEEDLDALKKSYKTQMDPLKLLNKSLQREVKTKKTMVKGILFHLVNHEDQMLETFDEAGEMVGSRRLRPDEKTDQARLFVINKAAANDH